MKICEASAPEGHDHTAGAQTQSAEKICTLKDTDGLKTKRNEGSGSDRIGS